ncbi:hypothetical protein CCMA1212_001225 [Trichoderma ghanense]|uniref:Uncharacterized protein n=1 Tax=Trichoderma ghanense TaxID=65468 RepID=A0ABY2HG50_9HYPO
MVRSRSRLEAVRALIGRHAAPDPARLEVTGSGCSSGSSGSSGSRALRTRFQRLPAVKPALSGPVTAPRPCCAPAHLQRTSRGPAPRFCAQRHLHPFTL